jgi:UDP-3-O-[3-hydroxymyristoyl] glucosamine N-acyltransferase
VIEAPWTLSFAARTAAELAERHGGVVRGDVRGVAGRIAPVERARAGDLAPVLRGAFVREAVEAARRGAMLLVDSRVAEASALAKLPCWVHEHAAWAMASVLDACDTPSVPPVRGEGCVLGSHVVLEPRVVLGRRVRIDAGSVIGRPGFGWATGPDGAVRAIPQLGGVIIEDDVTIGPLCTIDAGTLAPTIIRRGAKLDAQVHVGHNCEIGEGTIVAAQCGFAGSVRVGKGVLVGGQAGIADHITIGDGARIAAKSGVLADVAPGSTVAGYPAVARMRWLRGVAKLYRGLAGEAGEGS